MLGTEMCRFPQNPTLASHPCVSVISAKNNGIQISAATRFNSHLGSFKLLTGSCAAFVWQNWDSTDHC